MAAGLARREQRDLREAPSHAEQKNALLDRARRAGHPLARGACSSCRSTRCCRSRWASSTSCIEAPVAVWNPFDWSSSDVIDVWRDIFGSPRSPARSRRARSIYTGDRRAAVPGDRLPGGLLRRPVRRPPQGAVPRAADRAVLDQLHDADAGLDRPAVHRRLREQGARLVRHLPGQLAGRQLGGGGARPGLRLHPVPHHGAVRGPGPDRPRAHRGRPRPGPRQVPHVRARDAAAEQAADPRRRC